MANSLLAAEPVPTALLTWPATERPFLVESATVLNGLWEPLVGTVVETGGQKQMLLDLVATERTGDAVSIEVINHFDARDRGPSLSSDGLSLYFFSNILGHDDLWVTKRASLTSPWEAPVNLEEINTPGGEAFPSLSADGLSPLSWSCCLEGLASGPSSRYAAIQVAAYR